MLFKKLLLRCFLGDPLGYHDPGNDPMSCPAITVPSVDQALYDKLLAQATAAGVKFDGTKASIDGIELEWKYDAAAQVLTVTCLKKPFYMSCGEIQSKVAELIHEAQMGV